MAQHFNFIAAILQKWELVCAGWWIQSCLFLLSLDTILLCTLQEAPAVLRDWLSVVFQDKRCKHLLWEMEGHAKKAWGLLKERALALFREIQKKQEILLNQQQSNIEVSIENLGIKLRIKLQFYYQLLLFQSLNTPLSRCLWPRDSQIQLNSQIQFTITGVWYYHRHKYRKVQMQSQKIFLVNSW